MISSAIIFDKKTSGLTLFIEPSGKEKMPSSGKRRANIVIFF
jgi:hypothetical protein